MQYGKGGGDREKGGRGNQLILNLHNAAVLIIVQDHGGGGGGERGVRGSAT